MERVIVLGGTAAHVALIDELHRRNYFVILVDYLDNPPAKNVADVHIKESTMDFDAVLKVAKENNARFVISSSVDQANIVATYVNENLGLTNPFSYDVARKIADKSVMKRIMIEKGVPTTKYHCFEASDVFKEVNLKFPVIVKPVDSCAASGVKKANNNEELLEFFQNARKVSRSNRVIIEEFFDGIEVSAYCFITDHQAKIIMVSERLSVIDGNDKVLKCYATITPPKISDCAIDKIEKSATTIANAFGINNSPFHIQALVKNDDIDIIEFAPRVGGGVSYKTIKICTGFDIISATIDSYLNIPVNVSAIKQNNCCAVNIIYGKPGVYSKTIIGNSLFDDGYIESIHFHKTPGMKVTSDKASGGRIAAFITTGCSREEVIKKTKYVFERIDVIDDKGNSILRRDLTIK